MIVLDVISNLLKTQDCVENTIENCSSLQPYNKECHFSIPK